MLRQLSNTDTADSRVLQRFDEAIATMRRLDASVIDPVTLPELDDIPSESLWCDRFRLDINAYLMSLGPDAPVKSLAEIVDSDRYHPSIASGLRDSLEITELPEQHPDCRTAVANAERLREGVRRLLEEHDLDALIYPSWNNPPRLIGDLNSPHGNNSPRLSPHTGFPAITVPMGFVGDELPVGLQLLGDAWSEPTLIEIAYAFEQATRHRRPPSSVPPL